MCECWSVIVAASRAEPYTAEARRERQAFDVEGAAGPSWNSDRRPPPKMFKRAIPHGARLPSTTNPHG
jgi:hypothetical protein